MAAIVEVQSREFVGQSSPTPYSQFELKFSGLDQIYGANDHNPMVFFFENNNPSSKIQNSIKSQQLKESLYLTLTKFYPFAGKMNGDSSVICNGSGALYSVAEVDATLSDAVIQHTPNQIGQYLPLGRSSDSSISGKFVPLAIQVTFFSCGGTAIGVNYSKKIADSWTFAMFLRSWAATSRGGGNILYDSHQAEFGLGYSIFPPQDPLLLRRHPYGSVLIEETKMVMKRFVFNNQEIMSLKKLASSSGGCQNPNMVELVSAFIWKNIIQMKKSSKGNLNLNSKFVAKIEVNLRQQLGTPTAMGNFMVISPVLSTSDTELDYGFLVSEFRKAVNAFNNMEMGFGCVNYCSDLVEAVNKPEVWSCDFMSLSGYSLYDDMDFGWGKPLQICPKATSKPSVILGKAKNGNGVEAWINLSEDDMAILSNKFLPSASQREYSSATRTSSRL